MAKIELGELTAEQAAKYLRDAAEMTARHSQNWDNFQSTCFDMISAALRTRHAGQ
jgi:hypothetical protein